MRLPPVLRGGLSPAPSLVVFLLVASQMPAGACLQQRQRHDARAQQPAAQPDSLPTAIRKMVPDEGAKFFPDQFWAFEPREEEEEEARLVMGLGARQDSKGGRLEGSKEARGAPRGSGAIAGRFFSPPLGDAADPRRKLLAVAGNATMAEFSPPSAYLPAIAAHDLAGPPTDAEEGEEEEARQAQLFRRMGAALLALRSGGPALQRRQFACPGGTASCKDIGYPNSCCVAGETCFVVENTGSGPVGCCPSGVQCGGDVAPCPADHAACPADTGGGCCIPGFVCAPVGCVASAGGGGGGGGGGVVTTTETSVVPGPGPSTVVVTVTVTGGGGGVVTITTTSTVNPGPTSSTTVVPPPPVTTTSTTVTSGAQQPVRATTITSSAQPPGPVTPCPVGFYGCLATAGGGCCRTGRDCSVTDCPAVASTTIVNLNGETVVVPAAGVPPATTAGSCATGWALCPPAAGPLAGCCPTGYVCGTASCTFSSANGAQATVAKELPGAAGSGAGTSRMVRAGREGVVLGTALAALLAWCLVLGIV